MSLQNSSSSDGYVRIPLAALPALILRYLVAEIDCTIAVPASATPQHAGELITGFTEWVGVWENDEVSLGWDWAVIRDVVIVLNPTEIRTNILISETNRAESPALTRIYLLEKIESLPWTRTGIPELLAVTKK